MKKTIFIVDDNNTNLLAANEALEKEYRVMTLPSAAKMFALLEKIRPNLILLDIEMPETDGFEALQMLKSNDSYADIPVIFLTSHFDTFIEAKGLQLGAIDFITKPFSAPVLINRIKNHLNVDMLVQERTAQLQSKTEELQRLHHSMIFGFADMVESRDEKTGGHVERTAKYVKLLTDAMIARQVYIDEIKELDLELFISSVRLHDIGKIAISDAILNKPGKLTDEEYAIMKTHTTEGESIIERIVSRTGEGELFNNAKMFVSSHHERWDGNGYPYQLKGMDIPIQGRIMAIADVYDALVSERPYKKAFPPEEAFNIIKNEAGKHFDPTIVDVFCSIREQFEAEISQ
jgi:putative two-component system response regulator